MVLTPHMNCDNLSSSAVSYIAWLEPFCFEDSPKALWKLDPAHSPKATWKVEPSPSPPPSPAPTPTTSSPSTAHLTTRQARAKLRVQREKLRVHQCLRRLQNLRDERDRLVLERDQKLAESTNRRCGVYDQYLQLVEAAEQLHASNEELTKELEGRQIYSAAVETQLSSVERESCVEPDTEIKIKTETVPANK